MGVLRGEGNMDQKPCSVGLKKQFENLVKNYKKRLGRGIFSNSNFSLNLSLKGLICLPPKLPPIRFFPGNTLVQSEFENIDSPGSYANLRKKHIFAYISITMQVIQMQISAFFLIIQALSIEHKKLTISQRLKKYVQMLLYIYSKNRT